VLAKDCPGPAVPVAKSGTVIKVPASPAPPGVASRTPAVVVPATAAKPATAANTATVATSTAAAAAPVTVVVAASAAATAAVVAASALRAGTILADGTVTWLLPGPLLSWGRGTCDRCRGAGDPPGIVQGVCRRNHPA
jgi:hypothetical protein